MKKWNTFLLLALVAVGLLAISGCAGWDMSGDDSGSHSGHSGHMGH